MKASIGLGLAVVAVVLIGAGFWISYRNQLDVTPEEYAALETGMSYDDVVKALGREGKNATSLECYVLFSSAESYAAFAETTHYFWANHDGSGIVLTFDNDNKLADLNVPRLDVPGIMAVKFVFDDDGKVSNRESLAQVLGEETDEYIRLAELAAREDTGKPSAVSEPPAQ